jgi:hypothetical protein
MARIDLRTFAVVPLLLVLGACGDDPAPAPPPATSAPAVAPSSAPAPGEEPDPSDSVYVEEEPSAPEEPEPSAQAGDLPGEAQSYLDEALGVELGALEGAPQETADAKRAVLDKLPDNPAQVLAALKNYPWHSPEARALYDRATAAAG